MMITGSINAQELKFGKVSKKELQEKFYPNDTSADAAVLYKKRRTYYNYNSNNGWSLITEVQERIKLYNKDGFDHATRKIPIYHQSGKDESLSIKAYTYSLEGGKVKKTKLSKDNIFSEEISEHWSSKNFTMPDLKEGSIVEWKYTITSPYFSNINDVICQYGIPLKYMDAKIQIPEFFTFKYLPSRYYPIKVKESSVQKSYSQISSHREMRGYTTSTKTDIDNVKIKENIYELKLENVPALVDEPYVNNLSNYQARVDFEIAAYTPTYGTPEYFNTTWNDVTKTIYKNPNFGTQLDRKSYFKDELAQIITDSKTPPDRISSIFSFVKNKMTWNEENSKYVRSGGIKKAYKTGVGNSAEINLALVAMLREAGIKANPVLISTRSNGISLFPTTEGFNSVIAGIESSTGVMLLDATEKYSLPNVLPLRDLNWEGRLVREDGSSVAVNLYPEKFNSENIKINVKLEPEGNINGFMSKSYQYLNALNYRKDYNNVSEDDLISKIETENNGMEIEKIRINNKKDLSKPLVEISQFDLDHQTDVIGNKIYLSPLLFLSLKENPFKLEERTFPIDYGSKWKKNVFINIQIPEGYIVESKPDDILLTMPNSLGAFVMKVKTEGNTIQVIAQTVINSPIIGANYYKELKKLYQQAIEKQNEKIVLSKTTP